MSHYHNTEQNHSVRMDNRFKLFDTVGNITDLGTTVT
jgi:hypothetical protein